MTAIPAWLHATVVAGVLLAAPGAVSAHSPGVADADQAIAHEVEGLREEIARAVRRKDARTLQVLYSDSFTHTHASGRVDDKAAYLATVLAGGASIEAAPADDVFFRVFGNGTIVVTGMSRIAESGAVESRGSDKRRAAAVPVRWTCVYVKVAGRWQVAAGQATRTR